MSLLIFPWHWSYAAVLWQDSILTFYSTKARPDIAADYEGRVSHDIDIATGKANLKISKITLAENKEFQCRVLIPGDDEGTPADNARLVVLGNIVLFNIYIFYF